jgi:hypothetical protein
VTEPTTIRAELREQIEACEVYLALKPPPFHASFARTIHRHAVVMLFLLDAGEPQCLDDPPGCSHRLVPDPALRVDAP